MSISYTPIYYNKLYLYIIIKSINNSQGYILMLPILYWYKLTTHNYQKVLQGKRITIEYDTAKKYNIKEGDIVIVEDENDGIKIIPAAVVRRSS